MIMPSPSKLLLAVAVAASVIPAPLRAEPAAAPELTAQEREVLAAAEQFATDTAQVIERWITAQSVTEDRMFARFYYPIAKTDPQKYSTDYDKLAERDLAPLEDKLLTRSPAFHYAIATDLNGYVPAHNTRFAQPLTGNIAQDYTNNRSKRLLGDAAALAAARNEGHYLIQRTRTDTGDLIYDLSIPVIVRGKHWGCVRVGYRRTE